MFLKEIEIENVRSIQHCRIDFSQGDGNIRKWTFVLGENGAGKSTILRAIALLLAGSEALPALLVRPDDWIRFGASEARIRGVLVTAEGQERQIALRLIAGQGTRELFEENRETLDLLDRALSHSTRNYAAFGYGTSRRLRRGGTLARVPESFAQPRAQAVATLFSADAELVGVEDWAIDTDYRFGEPGLERVRETFRDLLRDVEFREIDKAKRELIFDTPDGAVPLRLLSDGYQNVIAWCGDLLYRLNDVFENYQRPLEARGLLLIDEIELHLHPLWQRQLVDFLSAKLPKMQLVVTTHSPLTAHQAGEHELYFLRRPAPQAGAKLEPYSAAPNKLLLHQLLTSPLFGLETLDSAWAANQKAELKELRAKKTKSRRDRARLKQLTESVTAMPNLRQATPTDRKVARLLENIDRKLSEG